MSEAVKTSVKQGDKISCPHCAASFAADSLRHAANRKVNCPECGKKFRVTYDGNTATTTSSGGPGDTTLPSAFAPRASSTPSTGSHPSVGSHPPKEETLFAPETTPSPGTSKISVTGSGLSARKGQKRPSVAQAALRRAAGGTLIGMTLGQVKITGTLGKGGMGVVYVGRHIDLDIDVAVKVLPDEMAMDQNLVQRFLREARLSVKLNHENIVRVYNVAQHEGLYYIVMELVEGTDAAHMLQNGSRFPYRRGLEIGLAAARALEVSHAAGLVHRDMKPHNILLSSSGAIKISDFGLARATESQSGLTVSGQLMGTPHYMSPEQAETTPIDHRSDIYSLGITLYHILVGHPPFSGETPIAVALAHLRKDVPFPDDVFSHFPPELVPVLRKMSARDPDQRYASATEVVKALEALLVAAPPDEAGAGQLPPLVSETDAFQSRAEERAMQSASMTPLTLMMEHEEDTSEHSKHVGFAARILIATGIVAVLAIAGVFAYREYAGNQTPTPAGNATANLPDTNPNANTDPPVSNTPPKNDPRPVVEVDPRIAAITKALGEADRSSRLGDIEDTDAALARALALKPEGEQLETWNNIKTFRDGVDFKTRAEHVLEQAKTAVDASDLESSEKKLTELASLLAGAPAAAKSSRARFEQDAVSLRAKIDGARARQYDSTLGDAQRKLDAGDYDGALRTLDGIPQTLLTPDRTSEIETLRTNVFTAIGKRFDSLLSQAETEIKPGRFDTAAGRLKQTGKLRIDDAQRKRMEALTANIPAARVRLAALSTLENVRRELERGDPEKAATELENVAAGDDEDLKASAAALSHLITDAKGLPDALKDPSLTEAARIIESLKTGLPGASVYETRYKNAKSIVDQFNAAIEARDYTGAEAAFNAIKDAGMNVAVLSPKLAGIKPREPGPLDLIVSGKWYQIEKTLRKKGWEPGDDAPSDDMKEACAALNAIGTEISSADARGVHISTTAISPDGKLVLCGCSNGIIECYDAPELKKRSLELSVEGGDEVIRMRFTPDGKYMLVGTASGRIICYDGVKLSSVGSISAHNGKLTDLAVSADSASVITGGEDCCARVYSVPALKQTAATEFGETVRGVDISSAAKHYFVAGVNGKVGLYSLANGQSLRTATFDRQLSAAGLSTDGLHCAVVSEAGAAYVATTKDLVVVSQVKRLATRLTTVEFLPDGLTLAVGDAKRYLRIYNYEHDTMDVVRLLDGHRNEILDISFTTAGGLMVTCSADRSVKLWNFGAVTPKKKK